jgi:Phospholipase B
LFFEYALSGTYNNQYMVIDLNRLTLGEPTEDGALWIIEQIPGLVVGTDQTALLRAGNRFVF